MNTTVVMISAAFALPVVALSAWVWITIVRVDKQLLGGFEGMHFET